MPHEFRIPFGARPDAIRSNLTVQEVIENSPNYSILRQLLYLASQDFDLRGQTIFAPTDAAFGRLSNAQLQSLQQPKYLKAFIQNHLIQSEVPSSEGNHEVHTLHGGVVVSVAASENGLVETYVGDARVLSITTAKNGTVYQLDSVLGLDLLVEARPVRYLTNKKTKSKRKPSKSKKSKRRDLSLLSQWTPQPGMSA